MRIFGCEDFVLQRAGKWERLESELYDTCGGLKDMAEDFGANFEREDFQKVLSERIAILCRRSSNERSELGERNRNK